MAQLRPVLSIVEDSKYELVGGALVYYYVIDSYVFSICKIDVNISIWGNRVNLFPNRQFSDMADALEFAKAHLDVIYSKLVNSQQEVSYEAHSYHGSGGTITIS